jgi:anthranilate synthase component I
MPHLPDFDAFCRLSAGTKLVPVYRRLLSDALTPVAAFHLLDDGGHACLFESVIGGEKVGRYSFLAFEPFLELTAHGKEVNIRGEGGKQHFTAEDPLEELRSRLAAYQSVHLPELPPFEGGAIGYAGYDVVRYVENLPNAPEDDRGLPDLSFAFYDRMIVFDNVNKALFVIAMARLDKASGDQRAAYDDACRRVDDLVERLSAPAKLPPVDIDTCGGASGGGLAWTSNQTREQYEGAVRRAVEYIQAGDIFQVVLGQRLSLELDCDPFEVYRTLRVVNPSPFMFFPANAGSDARGQFAGDHVPRGRRPSDCAAAGGHASPRRDRRRRSPLAEELLADPKERAEHVMLVDLGRNDVGRVAKFGSVQCPM